MQENNCFLLAVATYKVRKLFTGKARSVIVITSIMWNNELYRQENLIKKLSKRAVDGTEYLLLSVLNTSRLTFLQSYKASIHKLQVGLSLTSN